LLIEFSITFIGKYKLINIFQMKDKITEVALERFMQYGIRNMTIKKLVEPLGISTKTVYKYFASRSCFRRALNCCMTAILMN
jgi:AcrR family transcriptional regulator